MPNPLRFDEAVNELKQSNFYAVYIYTLEADHCLSLMLAIIFHVVL